MNHGRALIVEGHDTVTIGLVVGLISPISEMVWIVPGGLSFLDTGWKIDKSVRNSCGDLIDALPSRFLRRLSA